MSVVYASVVSKNVSYKGIRRAPRRYRKTQLGRPEALSAITASLNRF